MPIYLYKCEKCGEQEEYFFPRPGMVPRDCDSCGADGDKLRRVYDQQTLSMQLDGERNGNPGGLESEKGLVLAIPVLLILSPKKD